MDTRTATVVIRFKADDGAWKRATAARGGNGRIRPGYALINKEQVKVGEHRYVVRYYDKRKLKYEKVDGGVKNADTVCRRVQQRVTALNDARDADLQVVEVEDRHTLSKTAAAYIKDAEDRLAMEAAAQARNVTEEFITTCKKSFVDEITRQDVLNFHDRLRKRGCSERTVANKHMRLTSWLRFGGIDKTLLPPVPKYEETLPTIYSRDEIKDLLKTRDEYAHLLVQIALKAGLREQELMHLEYTDVDHIERVLRVQGKSRWGFKIKDFEQRDVPLPAEVLEEIDAWKKKHPGTRLILGREDDTPNRKLLRRLKQMVQLDGLHCRQCEGCKPELRTTHADFKGCEEYTLHKFRRTYLTRLLQNGYDLRTVQAYAGHKDLASTMRYLRPAAAKEAHEKLKKVKW